MGRGVGTGVAPFGTGLAVGEKGVAGAVGVGIGLGLPVATGVGIAVAIGVGVLGVSVALGLALEVGDGDGVGVAAGVGVGVGRATSPARTVASIAWRSGVAAGDGVAPGVRRDVGPVVAITVGNWPTPPAGDAGVAVIPVQAVRIATRSIAMNARFIAPPPHDTSGDTTGVAPPGPTMTRFAPRVADARSAPETPVALSVTTWALGRGRARHGAAALVRRQAIGRVSGSAALGGPERAPGRVAFR